MLAAMSLKRVKRSWCGNRVLMKRVGGMEIVMGIAMVTMETETEMGMETGMEMEMEIQDGYNLEHG